MRAAPATARSARCWSPRPGTASSAATSARRSRRDPPAHLDYDTWVGPAPLVPVPVEPAARHLALVVRLRLRRHRQRRRPRHRRRPLGPRRRPRTRPRSPAWAASTSSTTTSSSPTRSTPSSSTRSTARPGARKQLIFEQRIWSPYVQEGYENGAAFYGTKGMLIIGHSVGWKLYGPRNKLIAEKTRRRRPAGPPQQLPRLHPRRRQALERRRRGRPPVGHARAPGQHRGPDRKGARVRPEDGDDHERRRRRTPWCGGSIASTGGRRRGCEFLLPSPLRSEGPGWSAGTMVKSARSERWRVRSCVAQASPLAPLRSGEDRTRVWCRLLRTPTMGKPHETPACAGSPPSRFTTRPATSARSSTRSAGSARTSSSWTTAPPTTTPDLLARETGPAGRHPPPEPRLRGGHRLRVSAFPGHRLRRAGDHGLRRPARAGPHPGAARSDPRRRHRLRQPLPARLPPGHAGPGRPAVDQRHHHPRDQRPLRAEPDRRVLRLQGVPPAGRRAAPDHRDRLGHAAAALGAGGAPSACGSRRSACRGCTSTRTGRSAGC